MIGNGKISTVTTTVHLDSIWSNRFTKIDWPKNRIKRQHQMKKNDSSRPVGTTADILGKKLFQRPRSSIQPNLMLTARIRSILKRKATMKQIRKQAVRNSTEERGTTHSLINNTTAQEKTNLEIISYNRGLRSWIRHTYRSHIPCFCILSLSQ